MSRLSESREALIQFDAYRQRQKEGETPEVLVPLTGALYAKVSTILLIPYLFLFSAAGQKRGASRQGYVQRMCALAATHGFVWARVQGRLQCQDKVLVDIGAGYLLQKTCNDAKKDGERYGLGSVVPFCRGSKSHECAAS